MMRKCIMVKVGGSLKKGKRAKLGEELQILLKWRDMQYA